MAEKRMSKEEVVERMIGGVYRESPELWVKDALEITLDPWQVRAIRKLFHSPKRRLSVRGGHGIGKTWFSAIVAHYFLMNYAPSKIIVTGPTGRQTRHQFWSYLNVIWQQNVFKDEILWFKTKMFVKGYDESWFSLWTSSKEPKNIEGFHGPVEGRNLLWIIEEAKGVQDAVFESLTGALSHEDNFLYISSTCGAPRGHLYQSHTTLRHLYETEHVPSSESPRVSLVEIEKMAQQWGRDSAIFRARVLAEFPSENEYAICSLHWLQQSVKEEPELGETSY